MRKLGMVGGTGPESTISYYRSVVTETQKMAGLENQPTLTIESVNVFEVMRMCSNREYDDLTSYLASAVGRLASAGAELATLTGITPHIVFDRLQTASPIPLISAIEATRDAAQEHGLGRLVLLGTEFTMNHDFFAGPLREAGIEVLTPRPDEIAFIQESIVHELAHGIVNIETHETFAAILRRLRSEEDAQQVILGCTELPLLLNDNNSPLPCLDPVELHTRALVAAITSDT